MLPEVRGWMERLTRLRAELEKQDQRLAAMMAPGCDVGGGMVNTWVRALAETRDLLLEFYRRQIEVKDLDRGLVDFPSILKGKEVFLCWELGEEDIEFWHDLDAGYAGRERLE